jgi:hypothetical protein
MRSDDPGLFTPVYLRYPLAAELIRTQVATKCSDLNKYKQVMNNTPFYVLDAIEFHLQSCLPANWKHDSSEAKL